MQLSKKEEGSLRKVKKRKLGFVLLGSGNFRAASPERNGYNAVPTMDGLI